MTIQSLPRTLQVNLIPVNDPPTFDVNSSRLPKVITQKSGLVSVPAFLSNITPGGVQMRVCNYREDLGCLLIRSSLRVRFSQELIQLER